MAAVHVFYTLGYEKSDVADYVQRLRHHQVTKVVDVRSVPLSRKRGFSKKSLRLFLEEAGIDYLHMASLGAPKDLREKRRAGAPWSDYVAGYMEEVLSRRQADVEALANLAARQTISLLCFERNPNECHRSLLAAFMVSVSKRHALRVEHICY